MDIQTISTIAGLLSLGVTLLVAGVGGYYAIRSGVSSRASEAQGSAISAMQSELALLRSQREDDKREIRRLGIVIDTICQVFRTKGFMITITGDIINIEVEEGHKNTTIRIKDEGTSE